MTALKYGLAHPHAPGQFAPKHSFRPGGLTLVVASCLTAARILSDICAGPLLTSRMPSAPNDAVMFTPSAISM